MAEHQVLFCPFCRESFEGCRSCPDHDLALVSFDKLPPDPIDADARSLAEDAAVDALEPRFGRGYVAAGALLNALAMLCDFVRFPDGRQVTTLTLASSLPGLWALMLVSFTLLYVLRRAKRLGALRALRVLVPALALVAPATLGWELFRIRSGATLWLQHVRSAEAQPSTAVYVVLVASALILYGGVRLGVVRAPEAQH